MAENFAHRVIETNYIGRDVKLLDCDIKQVPLLFGRQNIDRRLRFRHHDCSFLLMAGFRPFAYAKRRCSGRS
jgi:hypothetical protein